MKNWNDIFDLIPEPGSFIIILTLVNNCKGTYFFKPEIAKYIGKESGLHCFLSNSQDIFSRNFLWQYANIPEIDGRYYFEYKIKIEE